MTATEQDKRTIPTGGTDTNALYVEVKVFLEGVQIPHAACAISYGVSAPPTCSITLPAASFLRSLPETTKILVVFKDLLPDPKTGEYEWRVLFDGEASGVSYSIDPSGANINLSGIHTTAYLTLMQFYTQSAGEYIVNRKHEMAGDHVLIAPSGLNKAHITFIDKLLDANLDHYASMADVSYSLLKNLIEGFKDKGGPVAAWYWNKLGPTIGGYKIVDRIAGVSDPVVNQPIISCDFTSGDVFDVNVEPEQETTETPKKEEQDTKTETTANTTQSQQQTQDQGDARVKRVIDGWITTRVEGDYQSVNWHDTNYMMSVGICGWNGSNVETLMMETGTPEAKAYAKCRTRADVLAVNPDVTVFHRVLNSQECRRAQVKLATNMVNSYITEAQAAGISNPDCIIYAAMWMPTCGVPNGLANRDIGLFIKNRDKNRYPSGINPDGERCVDINNPTELASLFKERYGQVMAEGFDYGTRYQTTLDYVNKTKSTSSASTTQTKATQETTTHVKSEFDTSYQVDTINTQRADTTGKG